MPSFAHIVKDDIALFDHAELIPRDGGHALVRAQCVDGVLQAVVFLPVEAIELLRIASCSFFSLICCRSDTSVTVA